MTWYIIHLRNGKDVLLEGDAARDRAMAKRSPRAESWSLAKIHQCSVCHTRGPWTDAWSWWGSWKQIDDGKPIKKFCSTDCRTKWSPTRPKPAPAESWDAREDLAKLEPARKKERSKKWRRRHEREQAMKAHRRFEMPVHANRGVGWCRWCGEEIVDRKGKNKGSRSIRRTWHRWHQGDARDCYHEYLLHTDADTQWWHLAQRDGIGCADCGRGDGKWGGHVVWWDEERGTGYCAAVWSVKLEVDHETPLWMIAYLPPDKPEWRIALFSPDNLKLRCVPCHQAKSAREAADRAARAAAT